MHRMSRGKATHSDRLERWLGKEHVETLSAQFRDFYWPVPLHGVPGNVFVMPGGDFAGEIKVGQFMSKHDGAALTIQKIKKRIDATVRRDKGLLALADLLHAEGRHHASIGAFASIDAVIAAWKAGKGQILRFSKVGIGVTAIGWSSDLWYSQGIPLAGGPGPDDPSGKAWAASDTGALGYKNRGAAGLGHYMNWSLNASVGANSLLLYDRLFSRDYSTGGTISITGAPTRYQNTTEGANDYAGGNFAYPVSTTSPTAMSSIGNWSNSKYKDQSNNAEQNFGSSALDFNSHNLGEIFTSAGQGSWFLPLGAGDVGVLKLTVFGSVAAFSTGTMDMVLAHPIAVNACPIANLASFDDGLYTSMSLTHIEDDACLSFLELPKPATTATTYSGIVRTVGE